MEGVHRDHVSSNCFCLSVATGDWRQEPLLNCLDGARVAIGTENALKQVL